MNQEAQIAKRQRVRAFLLSDRIDTANLEHDGVVSTTPVTYRFGKDGLVTLFRYGVAVTLCLSSDEEEQVLRSLGPRLIRPIVPPEEETLPIELAPDKDDQILPGGPLLLKAITPEHLIVIADALSKSVVLARDEREVAAVFEIVEPFARQLAEKGRIDAGRRTILKHIGNALLVSTGCRAAWRSPRNLTWFGTGRIWTAFMHASKTSMSSKNAQRRCRASSPSLPTPPRSSPTSSTPDGRCDWKLSLSY